MFTLRRVIRYGFIGGSILGTGISLHHNNYDISGIGVVRFARAGVALVEIATIYRRDLYYREWDKSTKEYRDQRSKAHQKAADRILELCCLNRGVYIKVGQHIGALEYLLPIEFVNTMKILHSQAPSNTLEEIYKVIRQDLRRDPSELFDSFDPEPLGVASLAQVHRATLKNGKEVAVKVQHHYVRGNAKVDMHTMEYCIKIMGWLFSDFKFQWLVDESKKNLPIELDFLHEGKNTEKVRRHFEHVKWLKIPKIFWELSTDRVLVMEYCEGGQVNDLKYLKAHNIDPMDVSNKLGILYSNMIFLNGYVHSDPHPGNILVHKNKKGGTDIVLLDHGLYAKPDNYERELLLTGGALVLPDIADILEKVDRQMLLVLKTNDLIRGIETTLQTHDRMTAFWVMSKCCIKTVRNEEISKTDSYWRKFALVMRSSWSLFKINFFYVYMGFAQGSFYTTMKQLFI
ncbi:CLUMA_CG000967, isoform A [Clunio marinus]|uniref:CLUMA_CG000967, isoform A n=1 Tax=Clunio marinus TaxID=568069 RepID=A0A1J1HL22_9DIPT|nr:CLUMA_CG000967, isoform A [Clunio marinus]